jgi:hypothetical protein
MPASERRIAEIPLSAGSGSGIVVPDRSPRSPRIRRFIKCRLIYEVSQGYSDVTIETRIVNRCAYVQGVWPTIGKGRLHIAPSGIRSIPYGIPLRVEATEELVSTLRQNLVVGNPGQIGIRAGADLGLLCCAIDIYIVVDGSAIAGAEFYKRTRAKDGTIAIETLRKEDAPKLDYRVPRHVTTGILFPNDRPQDGPLERISPSRSGGGFEFDPITETEVGQFNKGDVYFVVEAIFTYKDGFGDHWTHYCEFLAKPGSGAFKAKTCTDYNDADNN